MPDGRSAHAEARDLLDRGEYAAVVDRLAPWVRQQRDDVAAWDMLGAAYLQLGEWSKAEQATSQVLRLNPQSARALSNWGTTLRKLGRLDEARDAQTRALEAAPGYRRACRELGKIEEAAEEGRCTGAPTPQAHPRALSVTPLPPSHPDSGGSSAGPGAIPRPSLPRPGLDAIRPFREPSPVPCIPGAPTSPEPAPAGPDPGAVRPATEGRSRRPLYRVGVLCAAVVVLCVGIWATNRRPTDTGTPSPTRGTVADPNAPGSFANPLTMAPDDLVAAYSQDPEITHARYYGKWISLTAGIEWVGVDRDLPCLILGSTYSESADRMREQWERSAEKQPALRPPERGFGKIACRLLMPDRPVLSEDEQEIWHYRREASKLLEWYSSNLMPGRRITVAGKFADRRWETHGKTKYAAMCLDDPIVLDPRQPMPRKYVRASEAAPGG